MSIQNHGNKLLTDGKSQGIPQIWNGFMIGTGIPGIGKKMFPQIMKVNMHREGSMGRNHQGMLSSQKPRPTDPLYGREKIAKQ